ncbi:LpxL/LpxP family acyltransferase [Sphingobacterium athyrii]|uniref:LpxL/LpxP family acyltransferase n=1 Tax=Sphingobacterium athyrii TaxID=2152717 RepID=UPI0028AE70D4|nr:hypothetical protein [Sphingobacterium athyrii]
MIIFDWAYCHNFNKKLIKQLSKGSYKIACVPICSNAELTKDREITQKYIDLLKENIKDEPYVWLWTHKRWKR